MPNKTLSVRQEDLPVWDAADRVAKSSRMTLSALVVTAVEEYLAARGAWPPPETTGPNMAATDGRLAAAIEAGDDAALPAIADTFAAAGLTELAGVLRTKTTEELRGLWWTTAHRPEQ